MDIEHQLVADNTCLFLAKRYGEIVMKQVLALPPEHVSKEVFESLLDHTVVNLKKIAYNETEQAKL